MSAWGVLPDRHEWNQGWYGEGCEKTSSMVAVRRRFPLDVSAVTTPYPAIPVLVTRRPRCQYLKLTLYETVLLGRK